MKIFFTASVYGLDQYRTNYQTIIETVEALGHTVQPNHVLTTSHEEMVAQTEKDNVAFHKKLFDGIKQADVVLVEASYNSTSIGYLVATAVQAGKPVALFFAGKQEPHLFLTLEKSNDRIQVVRYSTPEDLKKEIPFVLDFLASAQDTRFNFFISPDQSTYLDWIAKNRKIPRSVYLRQLIETEIDSDKGGPFI